MRRLTNISVRGLLGQFDHRIEFSEEWDFLILYGPNGVGKTKLLELTSALFSLNARGLRSIPYEFARFDFSDGAVIEVRPVKAEDADPNLSAESGRGAIALTLTNSGGHSTVWVPRPGTARVRRDRVASVLEREFDLVRTSSGEPLWRDPRTLELLKTSAALERVAEYSGDLMYGEAISLPPDEFAQFFEPMNVHMINTQRLITYDSARPTRERIQQPTVVQFGQDLARRFKEALAANSLRSQQLDRTFPRRLLGGGSKKQRKSQTPVSEDRIRQKYEEQEALRARLASIAVLQESADLPLPDRQLEEWERTVLWMYLQDTDDRLATFNEILAKADLFREIVNSRFLFKELHFDPREGFRFVTKAGHEVSAASLSSGEQHELVLAYDLLFNVPPNSLVLIDEPEISLHVTWQQEFLNDIARIAKLGGLHFLVATHSPQIIHKWWSRAVPLTAEFAGHAPAAQQRRNQSNPPGSRG